MASGFNLENLNSKNEANTSSTENDKNRHHPEVAEKFNSHKHQVHKEFRRTDKEREELNSRPKVSLDDNIATPNPDLLEPIEYQVATMREQYLKMPSGLELKERIHLIESLRSHILEYQDSLVGAIQKDFHKPTQQILTMDIMAVISHINFTLKNLKKWARPKKVKSTAILFGTSSYIHPRPKGVVLIISPWNYSFQLCLNPLVTSIAAGNRSVIKPSEFTPNTSKFIGLMVKKIFDPKDALVFEGDASVAKKLLQIRFDHIFYTGSSCVGKIVAQAAAEHFASSTLELGGKSPCIVDETTDLKTASERIVFGKFVNAGQTCVAPDYILCPESKKEKLIKCLTDQIIDFYGPDESSRLNNDDLTHIVNEKHFQRLNSLLKTIREEGGLFEIGGTSDVLTNKITPTIISGIDKQSTIMKEEIFGPILPILTYEKWDEVITYLNSAETPLALYYFGIKAQHKKDIQYNTESGGLLFNDTLMHLANPYLPFGGKGLSGRGRYHGEHGFKELSHERAFMVRKSSNFLKFIEPPYNLRKKSFTKLILKFASRWL